jgi:hypothetical protein
VGGEEAERLEAERQAGAAAADSATTLAGAGAAAPTDDGELTTQRR